MSDEPATSFLRNRVKKAKQAAATSSAKHHFATDGLHAPTSSNQQSAELAQQPNQPHEPQAQPQAISKPDSQPALPISETDHPNAKPPTTKKTASVSRALKTDDQLAPAEPTYNERDALMLDLLQQHAPNKLAFEYFEPDLRGIMEGLILGAQIVGIRGHQDRMTVFRMMGLPWTPSVSQFRAETGGLEAMADRIARAVTRREGRLLGHDPVTIDVPIEAEAAPVLVEVE
jgi:hypothetical protein